MGNGSILIVDDEEDILQLLSFRLQKSGYDVLTASDGKIALGLLTDKQVDLILADIRMPNMGGEELCALLREDPKLKDIPLILISASKNEDSGSALSRSCARDFITKPFQPEELLAKIDKYIKGK